MKRKFDAMSLFMAALEAVSGPSSNSERLPRVPSLKERRHVDEHIRLKIEADRKRARRAEKRASDWAKSQAGYYRTAEQ